MRKKKMDLMYLLQKHWFLAGIMLTIFLAEIFPQMGAKEGTRRMYKNACFTG